MPLEQNTAYLFEGKNLTNIHTTEFDMTQYIAKIILIEKTYFNEMF
jgi:hypothetical protein